MSKKIYFTEEERKIANKERQKKFKLNHPNYKTMWYKKNKKELDKKHTEWLKNHPNYIKDYYNKNKEKIKQQRRKKLKILPKYKKTQKEKKEQQKIWKKNHPEAVKKTINKYIISKLQTDINFKLAHYLRNRLRIALYKNQKSGSAVKDLGCSISELKTHLESKFQEGMSWKNYGYRGWHIDHIIPLASFDLTNREEFLKANHFSNLQPLWAIDNIKKGNSQNNK